jgi:hypothetical protein
MALEINDDPEIEPSFPPSWLVDSRLQTRGFQVGGVGELLHSAMQYCLTVMPPLSLLRVRDWYYISLFSLYSVLSHCEEVKF